MIRKLRIKLIAASMLSLFLVLVIIMAAVNLLNYRSIAAKADHTLALLELNDGKFPLREDKQFGQKERDSETHRLSPELPYESRFFSVVLAENGDVLSSDTAHIAAVDADLAASLARDVMAGKKQTGFCGRYRYLAGNYEDGTRIIFLDCTRDLSTLQTFLFVSCGISLIGLIAVFVLIVLLSGRIIKPVSESYEKQKRFITDAGHEIKTPITIIDADAEVLEMELGENEWLQDIRKQAKRLGALTNELISLSRMEERLKLQMIDFPFSDVVFETAQSFQALAKTQHKTFDTSVEPMLTMRGDEKLLCQLISILLDNALKYSPEGGRIALSLKKQGKSICLTVTNTTAEPLKKENLQHLFDRFYRADPSRNSSTGGYGIGLSIAKAVVAAHRGKIFAASSDGVSLTVTAVLPMQ